MTQNLGELLVERGKIEPEKLQRARRLEQDSGERLGALLVQLGMLAERDLAETLAEEFRAPAEQAVKVDLALRRVAELQGLVPDDDALDGTLAEMAGPAGQDPDELKTRLAEVGQLSALRADLGKQAAMEWMTENVELVDENGDVIDRASLEIPTASDDDDETTAEESDPDSATEAE